LNLEWGCLARPDKVSEKVGRALGDAGCRFIDLGLESVDEEVLKAIRKDMTLEDTEKAIAILKKNKV